MMKRFYLMGLLVLGAMHSGMGQSRPGGQPSKLDRARLRAHPPVMQSTQVRPEPGRGGAPGGAGGSRLPVWGTEIGQTTYDLMSNRAVGQRLVQPAPGVLSAVWTQSCALTNGWPLRGIGYNYYANGSWANGTGTAGGCPSSFGIASFRTGWPEITVVNGEEVVFAHTDNPGVDGIVTTRRPLGTGAWAPTTRLPFTKDIGGAGSGNIGFWPRLASNGQTIHLLYCSNGSTTVGQLPSGIIGPTLYARSLDGGATWDQQNVHLPGMSNANFFSIGGDSYAIAANGNTVAVVAGGFGDHVVVWKSTDNGTTFTPRVIERVEDTDTIMIGSNIAAITSDGAFSITVDNGGKVHVWTGLTLASVQVDSVAGTGFKSAQRYFPLAIEGGLAYWNDAELA
ncbi:MAG TPA: hypothetical protein VEI97_05130, partial [bacterium]|nr:hypothetical protein [bacterium]